MQINFTLAEHHPLSNGLTGAGAFLDPHRGDRPEVLNLGGLTKDGHAIWGERQDSVDGVLLTDRLVADDLWHELKCVLVLKVEVFLGEWELGGGECSSSVRRQFVWAVKDCTVCVGTDLKAGAVLTLVHEGVHVTDDWPLDIALAVSEEGHGADVLHLVNGWGQRDARAGHLRKARTPTTTGDDDVLSLDGALVRHNARDLAIVDGDVENLDVTHRRQCAHFLCALAHDRASANGINDTDARRVEATEDHAFVNERNEFLNLGRCHHASVRDTPGLR